MRFKRLSRVCTEEIQNNLPFWIDCGQLFYKKIGHTIKNAFPKGRNKAFGQTQKNNKINLF